MKSKDEITQNIKNRFSNEISDKLSSLEMDVTNSFLTGKICSPFLMTAINASQLSSKLVGSTINTLNKSGLYITKDGLNYDPSVMVDAVGEIVNLGINMTTAEIIRLKDTALKEFSYLPDLSIIMQKALSYFSYEITNNIDFNEILDRISVNQTDDDAENKRNNNFIITTKNKVEKFLNETMPVVNTQMGYIYNRISDGISKASYYTSAGPEWVIDQMSDVIGDGSYIAETFLHKTTKAVNDWKLKQYDNAAKAIGKKMTEQYKKLLERRTKELSDNAKVQEKKMAVRAKALIQKANLAIMSKTGINIPLDKISPENLAKLKMSNKLSSLLQLAASAKPADEKKPATEQTTASENTVTENTNNQMSTVEKVQKIYTALDRIKCFIMSQSTEARIMHDKLEEQLEYYDDLIDDGADIDEYDYLEIEDKLDKQEELIISLENELNAIALLDRDIVNSLNTDIDITEDTVIKYSKYGTLGGVLKAAEDYMSAHDFATSKDKEKNIKWVYSHELLDYIDEYQLDDYADDEDEDAIEIMLDEITVSANAQDYQNSVEESREYLYDQNFGNNTWTSNNTTDDGDTMNNIINNDNIIT